MFGCGQVTYGVLVPTLMCLWQCMETKEKLMRYRLVTQRIILNKDNWTSLRYVTYVFSCKALIYRPLGKMESANRWPRELQRDTSNNIIGNKPLILSKNCDFTSDLETATARTVHSRKTRSFRSPIASKAFSLKVFTKKEICSFDSQLNIKQAKSSCLTKMDSGT